MCNLSFQRYVFAAVGCGFKMYDVSGHESEGGDRGWVRGGVGCGFKMYDVSGHESEGGDRGWVRGGVGWGSGYVYGKMRG